MYFNDPERVVATSRGVVYPNASTQPIDSEDEIVDCTCDLDNPPATGELCPLCAKIQESTP